MTRQSVSRFLAQFALLLTLGGSVASAQVDPVEIYPLPGGDEWTAILGAANMDGDAADEIVIVNETSRLTIVDSATGEIQFDSEPYNWIAVYAPGWTREVTSAYHRNHGYDIFCDEDGDGIYCANILMSDLSQYEYKLAVICLDRNATAAPSSPVGSRLQLEPNYPNPIGSTTRIDFSLAEAGRATVQVFDVQGRLVRTLVDRELTVGNHFIVWDGKNDAGQSVAAGTYFYELETAGRKASRKALLLR